MGSSTDHSHSSSAELHDPCGEFGPTQRWALVWFISVIAIGIAVSYTLCQIDARMYATNAEFFDYFKYKDNRYSAIRIEGDGFDERAHATVVDVKRTLLAKNQPGRAPAAAAAAAHDEPAAPAAPAAHADAAAAPAAGESAGEQPAAPAEAAPVAPEAAH